MTTKHTYSTYPYELTCIALDKHKYKFTLHKNNQLYLSGEKYYEDEKEPIQLFLKLIIVITDPFNDITYDSIEKAWKSLDLPGQTYQ